MNVTQTSQIIDLLNVEQPLRAIANNLRSIQRWRNIMNMRLISDSEIQQRQTDVRNGAQQARHSFSISGIRQLIGSTFIALGTAMHEVSDDRRETPFVKPTAMPAHNL